MITFTIEDFNNKFNKILQESSLAFSTSTIFKQLNDLYYIYVDSLNINNFNCPYCNDGHFTIHGYYQRYIITKFGKIKMKIKRIICSGCRKTHSLIPTTLIPYSLITTIDTINILINTKVLFEIDAQHKYYIIKKFKHLTTATLSLLTPNIPKAIIQCPLLTAFTKVYTSTRLTLKRSNNLITATLSIPTLYKPKISIQSLLINAFIRLYITSQLNLKSINHIAFVSYNFVTRYNRLNH